MFKTNLFIFRCLLLHKTRSPSLYTLRAMYSVISNCYSETYMTQYGRIPVDKLEILYSKSSGPGGQNVNKLKTKVQIRFNINTADWLPEEVRQAMLTKHKNKFTKDGILLLESQSTRNQLCNERNAIIKLQSIIERSFYKPSVPNEAKRLKIKELEASAKERRRMFKMSRKERKGDPFGYT